MKKILACLCAVSLYGEGWKNGFFVGLGGSYNSVKLDQHLNGTEFSTVSVGSSVVALGQAGGRANPIHATDSTLAPQATLGYLHRTASAWLLGCKAGYQYLGLTFTENDIDSFPTARYMSGSDTWIGHLFVSSLQTQVNHELFFLPMFGRFVQNSCLYLGAGPVVFETQNRFYGVTGFARLNGSIVDVTGTNPNLSSSQWLWGGIAELGWMYPLACGWVVDANYSYAVTENVSTQESALFSNSFVSGGTVYAEQGIATVHAKQRVTTQSVTITLNRVF